MGAQLEATPGPLAAGMVPLEYRYALDAAVLEANDATGPQPLVLCNMPELLEEVRLRWPHAAAPGLLARSTESAYGSPSADAALWIEPLTTSWEADLNVLAGAVRAGGRLVVIASQPLARILPGRRQPREVLAAGARVGGIPRLRQRLSAAGFHLEARYGLHSVRAIGANVLSRQLERWGRPDLADRLHFWARLHYCELGLAAGMSTVTLLVTSKVTR